MSFGCKHYIIIVLFKKTLWIMHNLIEILCQLKHINMQFFLNVTNYVYACKYAYGFGSRISCEVINQ